MQYTSFSDYYEEQPWLPFSEMILDWEDSFHELMLNDHIRMQAYKHAIKKSVRPGDTVLDLGAGTGILSQWALEAGASHVYAIEMDAAILERAIDRITQLSFASRFTPFNLLSYDVVLPEKVDVLISEIIGNMADNEDFQPVLNDAFTRFLKPGGRAIPYAVSSFITPISSKQAYDHIREGRIASLSEHYNIHRLLSDKVCQDPFDLYYDTILPASCYLAKPQLLKRYDSNWSQAPWYSEDKVFRVNHRTSFNGFKVYFFANLTPGVSLDIEGSDISAKKTSDSWKHAFLPIKHPFTVEQEDIIKLNFSRRPPIQGRGNFRQRYRWRGSIWRNGECVGQFDQGGEKQGRHGDKY